MKQGFDEWMDKNHGGLFDMPHQRECYEAGAQSRQGEVDRLQAEFDKLQKRIDDLKNWCVSGVECSMLSTEYNQALIDMFKILKGKENETRFN